MPRQIRVSQVPRYLRGIENDLKRDLENAVVEVGQAADDALVNSTRVDTSYAASNWVASLGRPFEGVVGAHFPGIGGSTETPSKAAAKSQFKAVSKGYTLQSGPLFVTNNVHYILKLNDGSPTNMPDQMIEQGMAAAMRRAKSVKFLRRGVRLTSRSRRSPI